MVTGPDLTIANMEFTQAIQTITNTAPLIADKPLVARMTVGVSGYGGSVANVTGQLRAFRNGVELSGSPLAPLNSSTPFTAQTTPNRGQLSHTLNFAFPTAWLAAGTLTIEATVNHNQTVTENSYANNTQSYQLTFNSIDPLEIVLVPIAFQLNGQGEIYRPTLDATTKFGLGYLAELFPVPNVQYTIHSEYAFIGDLYTNTGWGELLLAIRQLRNSEVADPNAPFPLYYGVVNVAPGCCYPGTLSPKPAVGGKAYVPGNTAVGLETTGMIIDYNGDGQPDPGYPNPYITLQEHMASHEIGHNFGLGHAPCNITGAPGFPNSTAEIEDVGFYMPTMSLVPSTHKDVMSYCFMAPPPRQWVSVYNYQRLFTAISAAQATIIQAQADQMGWLISGEIRNKGAIGKLYPTRSLPSSALVQDEGNGDYEIRIVDITGQIINRYAFTPDWIQAEEDNTNLVPPVNNSPSDASVPTAAGTTLHHDEEAREGSYSYILPYSSAAVRIQLWHEEALLDSLPVVATPPTLSANYTDNGNSITVSWSSGDDDPDYPIIMVRYSADKGISWQTLAHSLRSPTTSFTIAKDQLAATDIGLIEVIAGNSTQSTEVQLAIGAITNKAPTIAIQNNASRIYRPGESIILAGSAIDLEDGSIPAENFTWTIDEVDRVAITGDQFTLTDGLPAGTYTIRLSVVDSDGAQVQQTITITVAEIVERTLYLPYVSR